MKLSPDLVGKVVCIQLARPVYMMTYQAHVRWPTQPGRSLPGEQRLVGAPLEQAGKPVLMELLLAAHVIEVTDDSIKVALEMPGETIVHQTVPTALVLCVTEVASTGDKSALPQITLPPPASRIIQP